MRKITLDEVESIICIRQFRESLPEPCLDAFDWWVEHCSRNGVPQTWDVHTMHIHD